MRHPLSLPLPFALLLFACSSTASPAESPRKARIESYKAQVDRANREQGWQELPNGLWKSRSGDIAFRTVESTEDGIDIVHYRTRAGMDGAPLAQLIDLPSFVHLGGSYYADEARIYHHFLMADGGTFYEMEQVDRDSFRMLNDCYARDDEHIYTDRGRTIDAVDLATFVTSDEAGCFGRDRTGYFFWDERLDSLDELEAEHRAQVESLPVL